MKTSLAALSLAGSIGLVFVLNLGCTGSDPRFGSPTAPDADPPMVAGFWSGTATLEGVDGCGCIGATFQEGIGTSYSYTDELSQTRARIQGIIQETGSTDALNKGTCNYTGETLYNSIRQNSTDCSHHAITRTCSDGRTTNTLTFKSYRKRGPVSSSGIVGDIYVTFACTRSNGTEVGEMELFYSFVQRKS